MHLVIAGHETTISLIANLLFELAHRPDLYRAVRTDRALVAPAVEESLRHEAPVLMLPVTCARDVEKHGVEIPRDARVILGIASANRDDHLYDDPDEFRLD